MVNYATCGRCHRFKYVYYWITKNKYNQFGDSHESCHCKEGNK